jgi:hypothetical protein
MQILRLGLTGCLLATAVGCGGPKFYPVKGQLVFPDGNPVTGAENGTVVFEATGPDGKGYSATGPIDAQGRFEMTTETPRDGAVPGPNKVSITPPQPTGDTPLVRVLSPKYEKADTSGLTADVKPQSNDIKLTVEPAKPKR